MGGHATARERGRYDATNQLTKIAAGPTNTTMTLDALGRMRLRTIGATPPTTAGRHDGVIVSTRIPAGEVAYRPVAPAGNVFQAAADRADPVFAGVSAG